MTQAASLLAALNRPLITGSAGVAAAACLGDVEHRLITSKWTTVRLLNLVAFAVQFFAAGQPGRLDDAASSSSSTGVEDKKLTEFLSLRSGGTLVAPSGWAFAIWAPIFLGEMIMVLTSLTQRNNLSIQAASGGFIAAQVFQTLWAATFRPKYYDGNSVTPWLSSIMLTGIACSLSRSHEVLSAVPFMPHVDYVLYVLPITLHFAWATAASLVNWNGNAAIAFKDPKTLAVAGGASVVGATALGVFVTLSRRAPVYGSVICWALAACATGMTTRLAERERLIGECWLKTSKEGIRERKGFYGAVVQKWLCVAGATMTGAVAAWTAVKPNNVAP